ncbi:Inosine-uridine nucleoside N-ribohydrolase [Microlunatus sagamiharensis]|uniref:Inosine-uridine nucleoside N-ribohydrolase n=1 Tax=Microlunatus sagamiharensis TaxID=546874 RepID=A0A1H2M1S6_9ACTN|nr:nucleoside hydrolase [Microlunatus sagamiharensis]SDU86955.1 Inosine-uridine nucleoside N-ribohydrolase [Microlunatus sagamiharensis]
MRDPRLVALDTDLAMGAPGSDIDDGFALALALGDPGIDLRLVTTVNGNTDVATATTLTLELLDRMGRPEVEVRAGATRPLLEPARRQGALPPGVELRSTPPHASVALAELVRAHPGEVTVVAVGPLTNVALAMLLDPGFAAGLGALVVMGGVFTQTTGSGRMPGEFNVWVDPAAARVVLQSAVVATWVGLDVTRQVRVERSHAEAMAADPHAFTSFAGRATTAWIDHLAATEDPGTTSCPLHDPLAVAAVTQPDLLGLRGAHLEVQLEGPARGVLVADLGVGPDDPEVNARIATRVDAPAFAAHLAACLRRL